MTQHLHSTFVDGCYRCDLSRDEIEDTCELGGQPIFIDGKVPCHACGWSVKALLVDGLWVYEPHAPDGSPLPVAPEDEEETR